jgi:5'-phosphate synthase pdxT subunit
MTTHLTTKPQQTIGILAFQGSVAEHWVALESLGIPALLVRSAADLSQVDGLILPGGESTTIGLLMERYGLLDAIRSRVTEHSLAVWGTCAGAILLAKEVEQQKPGQPLLRLMDIVVARNAFGRQLESFEEQVSMPALGADPVSCIFIRAPKITNVLDDGVAELGTLRDGTIVAARQGNLLATSFHTELARDTRVHAYFASMVREMQDS